MKCRTQVIFKTAATVQTFVLTSDTQCTVCRGHNFTGTVHIFFSVRVTIYWECTQFFFCQGHNLLGLYTVFFLSGSQFYWDCTQFFPVRVTIYWDCTQFFSVRVTIYWDCTQIFSCQGHNFTGTVHSFFMSGSQFYWDCTQFFFCQGHNLLGLYTVYCLTDSTLCTNKQWYPVAHAQQFQVDKKRSLHKMPSLLSSSFGEKAGTQGQDDQELEFIKILGRGLEWW